jgi:hypothetical protein
MHLIRQLWKNLAYLNAIGGGLNGLELALSGSTRLRIPSVNVAHPSTVPKKDHVLSLRRHGCAFGRKQVTNRHSQQGGGSGRSLNKSTSCDSVIVTVHSSLLGSMSFRE